MGSARARTPDKLEVHVFDQVVDGPKPQLHLTPDIIIECTGATPVIADAVTRSAPSGIVCLPGLSSRGHTIDLDLGGVNRRMVLENDVIFGSVNANRTHYEAGAAALKRADRTWLSRLISRRVPLDHWREAFVKQRDDVKVVIEFGSPS